MSGLWPVSGHGEMGWTIRQNKVPKYTIIDTIKGVHVLRQQAGAPKSRYPLKSVLKLTCRILGPRKWMAHIVSPMPDTSSIELGVGGCGHFIEGVAWAALEECLLQILIEVAIIQACILGADEE